MKHSDTVAHKYAYLKCKLGLIQKQQKYVKVAK